MWATSPRSRPLPQVCLLGYEGSLSLPPSLPLFLYTLILSFSSLTHTHLIFLLSPSPLSLTPPPPLLTHILSLSSPSSLPLPLSPLSSSGLEMFHKSLDEAQAGDQLGVLVRGVKREDVRRGMVVCAPGSLQSHVTFKAQIYVLTKEEGGRHTPFVSNYIAVLFTRTANVAATITLPSGEPLDYVELGGRRRRGGRAADHCTSGGREGRRKGEGGQHYTQVWSLRLQTFCVQ